MPRFALRFRDRRRRSAAHGGGNEHSFYKKFCGAAHRSPFQYICSKFPKCRQEPEHGFDFIDGPRNYSPVVSVLRLQPGTLPFNFEWRTDYDPLRHRIVNSSFGIDGRIRKYFWSFRDTDVNTDPSLEPRANQIGTTLGYGNPNSRGWNYGLNLNYNVLTTQTLFWDAQVTYNSDCCGFSVQYRRINLGTRDDTQIEGSFAISNIGSFGSLKRQDRIF